MGLLKSNWQAILVVSLLFLILGANDLAQEKPKLPSRSTNPALKALPAKSHPPAAQSAGAEEPSVSGNPGERDDDADLIRRRDEWFYKQRSSANGRIPQGARYKAFQHMQRMMVAEGKLALHPDGTYAAATPQAGSAIGGAWSSLGPTPTTGGFFSPVSGRIEAIAVDPSDATGNTLLIGGAQGGIWRSTDAGSTWTPVGDQNPSLAMGSIAFAPSNPSIVYAGTGEQASIGFDTYYGAGVLVSTDHGQTWKQTCTAPSSTCPFIGPSNNTLNFGFYNDGGARISYIAVNPVNSNLVLVGAQIGHPGSLTSETSGAIYCSSDGGGTWTSILSGGAASFVGFATSSIAYAALGGPLGSATGAANPNGVYKSTTANPASCSNITFNPVAQQPTTLSMGRIDLGIAPSDTSGNTVYASIAAASNSSQTNLGVFVTKNGGTSWTQTSAPDICSPQCWYDDVVKVHPTNPNIVFLGGGAVISSTPPALEWVMRSTNAGAAWNTVVPTPSVKGDPTVPHVDVHSMAFFNATSGTFAGKVRLYVGNDGGLWRTDDAEASTVIWTNLNQNLSLTQFYPNLSVNPSNPTIAFGGAQDNGSQVSQGSPNWTDNGLCGDGGQTAVDFQIPSSVYITCPLNRLLFSPTGGTDPTSYIPIGAGINSNLTDAFDFIPPVATDPSTPGRVYFGTDHVYQSSDNGNNFSALSGPLPSQPGNYLTTFGVSLTNPAVVYAGDNSGDIFIATNVVAKSASFSQVAGQNQHPLRPVTSIAVDPHDTTGNTVYASFSGFAVGGQDTLGHIFVSTNGGATWSDVSCTVVGGCQNPAATDLPNIPVNDLVIDPDLSATTLYAATDIGVFQGTCSGTTCTWNTLGTGLPNVAVLSLKLHEASRTLIAGTHGRGAWSLVLTNFAFTGPRVTSLSPISTQALSTSALVLTVNGSGLTGATAVQWKTGATTAALTPTVMSDSQVTANVPTNLLASGGTAQVSVSVGSANSNSLTFSVLSGPPTVSGVSPANAAVNSANTTITVTGANFSFNSQVMLNPDFISSNAQPNGKFLIPTSFTDSQHLSAIIPASFLANFGGTNSIGVLTPPPGGGTTLTTATVTLPAFTVVAPPPANDNFANAISISANSFTDTKDSSGATTEAADPTPPCAPVSTTTKARSNSIWYQFNPASTGVASLDTSGSNFHTVLSIWTGSNGNLTSAACNNGLDPLGIRVLTQLKNVNMTGGTTYFIMLSSFGPPDPNPVALGGKSILNFTFIPNPDFAIASTGTTTQTVAAGQKATFTNSISVTAQNGFASQVNLACSLPVAATNTTCTVSPNMMANGSGTASVSVTTTANSLLPPSLPFRRFYLRPELVALLLLTLLLATLMLRITRSRRQRLVGALPLAMLVLFILLQAIGCGGGGSTPPGGGTPAGTYTISVTGTSGSLIHSTTLTVTVN